MLADQRTPVRSPNPHAPWPPAPVPAAPGRRRRQVAPHLGQHPGDALRGGPWPSRLRPPGFAHHLPCPGSKPLFLVLFWCRNRVLTPAGGGLSPTSEFVTGPVRRGELSRTVTPCPSDF